MSTSHNPEDSLKVMTAAIDIKKQIDMYSLNDYENVSLLKLLLAHQESVLQNKNATALIFKALNNK